MRKPLFLTLLLSLILSFARADGGMWIPLYLSQKTHRTERQKGKRSGMQALP